MATADERKLGAARKREDGMSDEFAHRLPLNQIRDGERIDLSADEAERRRIAERIGLRSLDRLRS